MAYLDETSFECARQQSVGGPIVAIVLDKSAMSNQNK